jgi:hypothetical protein
LVSSNDGYGDVFRVVIANPNTTIKHCIKVLDEQRFLLKNDPELQAFVQQYVNNKETK